VETGWQTLRGYNECSLSLLVEIIKRLKQKEINKPAMGIIHIFLVLTSLGQAPAYPFGDENSPNEFKIQNQVT
jgi:hypothetical protein